MNTRFSSLDNLLKETTVTPLQEAAMNLLVKADYRPEPIDSPFIEGWDTKQVIVAPQRVTAPCEILAAYDMPVRAVYCLRRHLIMPVTKDENGRIVPDDNYKMNLLTIPLLVFFPLGFYYLIGRWLFVHDTVVLELSDGSFILVLRWNEKINWWWYAWVASCFAR